MVEEYILRGRQNARTRQTLCTLTGLSDRAVRREIEDLRERGEFIITDEDGKGYYISEDYEDVKRQYLRDTARIKAISKRTKHLREFLKDRGEGYEQISLEL